MLSRLYIRNYAIIRELDISFSDGLNIITGETGAGKSILMGALNLVLGERADKHVLYDNTQKCILEAVFLNVEFSKIKELLDHLDVEDNGELILRRELQANGKSRSFINDSPVTLTEIKKLGAYLIDLHQQFDTSALAGEQFQTDVLDAMAGTLDEALKLNEAYREFAQQKKVLEQKEKEHTDALSKQDYRQYLFDELDALHLRENELEDLEQEWKSLTHVDQIKHILSQVTDIMEGGDSPLVQQLKSAIQKIESVQSYRLALQQLMPRLQSAFIEIKDIASEISNEEEMLNSDPGRMAEIEERLHIINKLLKKHHVQTTQGLLNIHQELSNELLQFTNRYEELEKLKISVGKLENNCLTKAEDISKKRKKIIPSFEKSVHHLLKQLGMPNAVITVEMNPHPLRSSGIDQVQILFDANKSARPEPLGLVASGGELSRLMLSIKSLVAGKMQLPTLIFDEIDTGISGEAARQVALLMQGMSNRHQLMCITHQPQIAAKADTHYFIYKEEKEGKVHTAVRRLTDDERVEVIAQMMSGEKPTTAAIKNAREMVTGKE